MIILARKIDPIVRKCNRQGREIIVPHYSDVMYEAIRHKGCGFRARSVTQVASTSGPPVINSGKRIIVLSIGCFLNSYIALKFNLKILPQNISRA